MRSEERSCSAEQRAVRVLLLDRPEGGRRGEQRGRRRARAIDPPERAGVGRADRLALVEHGRGAGEQRRVDDVGVADDPADVAGGPPHVARADAVDVAHRPAQRDGVPAVVADDALGPARRAGGVEDVERVGRRDVTQPAGRRRPGHQRRPSRCRARRARPRRLLALQDDARARAGGSASVEGRVEHRLVLDDPGRLDPARRGDDDLGPGVVDAGGELGRREAAEDDGVDGADAGRRRASRRRPRGPSACR